MNGYFNNDTRFNTITGSLKIQSPKCAPLSGAEAAFWPISNSIIDGTDLPNTFNKSAESII